MHMVYFGLSLPSVYDTPSAVDSMATIVARSIFDLQCHLIGLPEQGSGRIASRLRLNYRSARSLSRDCELSHEHRRKAAQQHSSTAELSYDLQFELLRCLARQTTTGALD